MVAEKHFILRELLELVHNIKSVKNKMMEADPNLGAP